MSYKTKIQLINIFIIVSLFSLWADRNQDIRFDHLDRENGLSFDSVSSITQDKKGYIWFGTQEGLSRFDGNNFTHWYRNPYDTNSLSSNLIQTLYIDGDTLWIGTYKGLNSLHIPTGAISRYEYNEKNEQSISNNVVTAITKDTKGVLWVGTLSGLNKMDKERGTFKRFTHEEGDSHTLPHEVVRSLHIDLDGILWVGTYGGLSRFNSEEENFSSTQLDLDEPYIMDIKSRNRGELYLGVWGTGLVRINTETMIPESISLPDNRTYSILLDDDRIWVASFGGGLIEVDEESDFSYLHHSDSPSSNPLSNDTVYSLFKDRSGILWVGTNGGGVNRIIPGWERYNLWIQGTNGHKLNDGLTRDIMIDDQNDIWVSIYNKGVFRLNQEGKILNHYMSDPNNPYSLSNDIGQSIFQDSQQRIWVGTNKGLNLYDRENDRFISEKTSIGLDLQSNDHIYSIINEDRLGQLWLGLYSDGLMRFSPEGKLINRYKKDDGSGLSDNLIRSILVTQGGELWVGTNYGLNRLNEETGQFINYYHDDNNRSSLSTDAINTLLEDSKGTIWIGTDGGGLCYFNDETNGFMWFPMEEGSLAMNIDILHEDEDGYLWVGSHSGLFRISPDRTQIENVGTTTGFPDVQLSYGHVGGKESSLFFGTHSGIVKIYPHSGEFQPTASHLTLTSLTVLGENYSSPYPIDELKEIKLKHSENLIEFRFAQLNHLLGLSSIFSYHLEGLENEWHYTSENNRGRFSYLPPGKYTLVLRSQQTQSLTEPITEELRIPLTVSPPLWASTAAYLLYLLLLVLFILFLRLRWKKMIFKQEEERKRELHFKKELEKKVEERTKELIEVNRKKGEMEDKLKQSEKLSAIGQLAGGIAHDFNNQLQGILGFSEQLQDSALDTEQKEYVENIIMSANNSAELTEKLLAFARKGYRTHRELELIEIIKEVGLIFQRTIDRRIELVQKIEKGIPLIIGDKTLLQNALLNVLLNARDAIEGKGQIFLEVCQKKLQTPLVGVLGDTIPKGDYVTISIKDSGIGIPSPLKSKIFEPFFTTKKLNEGTGMGLAAVYGTVKSHDAYLTMESQTGKGTQFTIFFKYIN